jgi:UDPglucose 6-dehydrogenase
VKIGVIGLGVVGTAVHEGLKILEHETRVHDIKLNTTLDDVLDTEICFICVPTPSGPDGECDVSIVDDVVGQLGSKKYSGVVAIKSTVEPGTTDRLSEEFPNLNLCFVPEFLRERCATEDFVKNHDLCVIGTKDDEIFKIISDAHGHFPEKFIHLDPLEAEFVKYFNNIYNATLVTFANSFYEVCKNMGADYTKIKDTIVNRKHINDVYMNCNENLRGFGGPCLPKDTRTIASLVRKRDLNVDFFKMLLNENCKYKITVFDGMREE